MKARLTLFNCATLTASVSALPAATPVIWRVFVPSPTEAAPQVPLHVFAAVGHMYLYGQLFQYSDYNHFTEDAVLAIDPAPSATPFLQ